MILGLLVRLVLWHSTYAQEGWRPDCFALSSDDVRSFLLEMTRLEFPGLLEASRLLAASIDAAQPDRNLFLLRRFLSFQNASTTALVADAAFRSGTLLNESGDFHLSFAHPLFQFLRNTSIGDDPRPSFLVDTCHSPETVSLLLLAASSEPRLSLQVGFPLNLDQCLRAGEFPGLRPCLHSKCKFVEGGARSPGSFQCCCTDDDLPCMDSASDAAAGNRTSSINHTLCLGFVPDDLLRKVLLSVNSVCAIISFSLIFMVMTQRRVQEYGARGWALMELFLIGAVLLYSVVILEFPKPNGWTCCLMVWCRQLGFTAFYGAIVLKIYRNLVEYRVRKAHHVYVKEKDLLKYLSGAVVITGTGVLAWTLGAAQRPSPGHVDRGRTSSGLPYHICKLEYWSIVWHSYEFFLLLYGLWLCYKARNTTWVERWQFTIAVILEVVVTLTANCTRYYLWYGSNPDTVLLLSFIQSHLTITVNMLLIVVPKFYYVSVDHGRTFSVIGSGSSRAHPSLAKLRDNLVNGTVDFAEIPIADMNPEDIRAELKRVYTQLRMYKLKNVYDENPHISKRKQGKKQSSDKQAGRRRMSHPTPSQSTVRHRDVLKLEEERSSTVRSSADDEPQTSDLTVRSSPHNALLARGAAAATKKFQLQPDLSVRV